MVEPQCGGGYLWGGEGVPYKVSVLAIELENCRVDQRQVPCVEVCVRMRLMDCFD